MDDQSFITLHRKIINSACFADAELFKVWMWCLLRANYKDREVVHGGQVILLNRGEFITGRFKAVEELHMTPMKFRSRIATLVTLGQITQKTTNKFTVYSVVKYDDYQSRPEKLTNKYPTNNQQITTDNNINNINNTTSDTSLIENMTFKRQPDDFEEAEVDYDGDGSTKAPKKPQTKKYPNAPLVFKIFEEVSGKYPANWKINKTQLLSAENLFTERGLQPVKNALEFYKQNKDTEFCPQITQPSDLDAKWTKLGEFKKKTT